MKKLISLLMSDSDLESRTAFSAYVPIWLITSVNMTNGLVVRSSFTHIQQSDLEFVDDMWEIDV